MDYPAHFMSVAKPLYALGDLVVFSGECEEGLFFCPAYITGVEYKTDKDSTATWWYAVRTLAPAEHHSEDSLPENEIVGRVLHGT